MIRLLEIVEQNAGITIDDVERLVSDKYPDRDSISLLKTVEAFYYSGKEEEKGWAMDYLNLLNKVLAYILETVKKLGLPHVDVRWIRDHLLKQSEFKFKLEEFFPFPLYISSGPQDEATVGIMIDSTGKVLESHEGNDEATPETVQLVNKLVNPSGKKVRVYGLHGTELCHKIDETGYLPANLYVSPDRTHAGTHWQMGQDRSMFTGIVDINDLSQESEIDWKTMGNTKIDKFRWL